MPLQRGTRIRPKISSNLNEFNVEKDYRRTTSDTGLLDELGWLPLFERRRYSRLTVFNKGLNTSSSSSPSSSLRIWTQASALSPHLYQHSLIFLYSNINSNLWFRCRLLDNEIKNLCFRCASSLFLKVLIVSDITT